MASDKQFIELAVNIPAQLPQVGHASFSISIKSLPLYFPFLYPPTASKQLLRSISLSLNFPASMGPPLTIIEGIFNLRAAISIPGIILSQFVTKTSPSNG